MSTHLEWHLGLALGLANRIPVFSSCSKQSVKILLCCSQILKTNLCVRLCDVTELDGTQCRKIYLTFMRGRFFAKVKLSIYYILSNLIPVTNSEGNVSFEPNCLTLWLTAWGYDGDVRAFSNHLRIVTWYLCIRLLLMLVYSFLTISPKRFLTIWNPLSKIKHLERIQNGAENGAILDTLNLDGK